MCSVALRKIVMCTYLDTARSQAAAEGVHFIYVVFVWPTNEDKLQQARAKEQKFT